MDTPQRPYWSGDAAVIGELFRVRKISCSRQLEAVCELRSHQFGWECRLAIGEDLLQSEVCRSEDAVAACSERWKAAMVEKGWS